MTDDATEETFAAVLDLAGALLNDQTFHRSLAAYDLALRFRPRSARALGGRALALLALDGASTEAAEAVELATAADPEEAFVLGARGVEKLLSNQRTEAADLLARAVAAAPDSAWMQAQRGEALRMLGRVEEAIEALDLAVAMHPRDYLSRGGRGAALRALGRDQEALAALDEALHLNADYAFGYGEKALILMKEDRDAAIPLFQKALELDPTLGWVAYWLADVLRQENHLEEALAKYEQALASDAWTSEAINRVMTLRWKAETLRLLDRDRAAIEVLDELLASAPDDAFALATKGQIYRGVDDDEAVALLQRGLAIDEGMAWAHAELGEALRSLRRYEESLQAFERALEIQPDYVFALGGKGETLRLLGRLEDATATLQRSLELEPQYAFGLRVLGQIERSRGEVQSALELAERLDRVATSDEDHAYAQAERGELLRLLNRYPESVEAFNRSLALTPDRVYALGGKGETLRLLGRYEEAVEVLDKAIALDPTYGFGLGIRGRIWSDGADYAPAIDLLSRAVELEPGWTWALATKAWAQRYLGGEHLRAARESWQQVVGLEPESAEYRVLLADVLRRLGAAGEARAEYARVVAEAEAKPEQLAANPDLRAAFGWCLLFVDRGEEAIHHLTEAVASGSGMVEAQFSLALAMARQGLGVRSLREYQRGVAMGGALHPLRQRGVFFEALQDLRDGCEEAPEIARVEETKNALDLLETSFESARQTVH